MANASSIKNKKLALTPEQVFAIIRLKAYEFYLKRVDGEKTVAAFESWFVKQKITQNFEQENPQ